jgi:hypothetical protein
MDKNTCCSEDHLDGLCPMSDVPDDPDTSILIPPLDPDDWDQAGTPIEDDDDA